jgi:hypothetical protein
MSNIPKKLRVLIHGIGLGSVGSALFLQSTVFTSILKNGYFRGIEQNPTILYLEIGLTGIAIVYFGYMFVHFIFSNK